MKEILNILFPFVLLILILFFFIRISLRLRKRGGSLTSTMFGATWELYNYDKRQGIKEIVEQKSDKKRKEDKSGEPGDGKDKDDISSPPSPFNQQWSE